MKGVIAAVKKDLPISVSVAVSGHTAKRSVRLLPDLRVAELKPVAAFRQLSLVKNRIALVFLIVNAIADGDTLGSVPPLLFRPASPH